MSGRTRSTRIRVRYAETDQLRVVYYANYFVWFEVGRTDWLRDAVRTEYFIKTGLVIMGATILFAEVLQAGALGLVQAVGVVTVVWYVSFWIAKRFRVDDEFAVILSSAVSICGVSAAIAACGAIEGDRRKLSYVTSVVLIVALLMSLLPLPILFILAFAIALPVNYPSWEAQQKHLVSHAGSVVTVSTMIFAAGIFTGVLTGTGMIEAMARAAVSVIPASLAEYLPLIVAVTSMPLSLVFTPDAYYFGVLPVLAQAAASFGVDPVLVGRGAILGQMTTGFPLSPLTASTFILIGLSGVNLGDHQRFIFPWAFGTSLVMTAVAFATGVLSG